MADSQDASVPTEPPPEYSAGNATTSLAVREKTTDGDDPSPASKTVGPPLRRPPPPLKLPIIDYLRTHRVILASASPRRKNLLAQIGVTNVEIWPSTKPEDLSKETYGPLEYAGATARQKCLDVYQAALAQQEAAAGGPVPADPQLVIAADTVIVSRSGQVLEKPRSAQDHAQMLRHLRDTRFHRVLTAVCVLAPRADAAHPGYMMQTHTEETKVVFARESDGLSDAVLEGYVRTREGADKAGGYALQGTGGLVLVERIEGNVDNVIGLPVRRMLQLAEKVVFGQDEEEIGESDDDLVGDD